MFSALKPRTLEFQFTPLREGRLLKSMTVILILQFQFTPLREGRPEKLEGLKVFTTFQFTPLREGRQLIDKMDGDANYFNSRPSARGDCNTGLSKNRFSISIHAPPRGATYPTLADFNTGSIFQFTPLREGRPQA